MKRKRIIEPFANFAGIINLIFLQLIIVIGLACTAHAQELNPSVISTGGETYTASGYFLDFVIGEIAVESYTNQGFMLTQGFLQGNPDELAVTDFIVQANDIDVYPNPASDMIYINCQGKEKPVRIEIKNLQGCMVYSMEYCTNPMAVSLKLLNPGLYVLTVISPDHNFVSKKIIKK